MLIDNRRSVRIIAILLIMTLLSSSSCQSENTGIDYLSGKWFLDTEKYISDITNGKGSRGGFLFGELSVIYEFKEDNILQIIYQEGGLLPESIFPNALRCGETNWKYSDGFLDIGEKQFELSIIDDEHFILCSDDLIPQLLFTRVHILDEIVEFGRYEQDGNVENGKEGIEWFIIQETDSYKLLLSRCALEIHPMDELTIDSFENSSLCAWLNTTFYESFNEDERRKMLGLKLDDEGRTIGVLENETQLPYVSLLSLSDAKNLIERNVYLFPIHSIGSDNWENDIKLTLWLSTVNEYAFGSTGYCVDKYNVIAEMLVSSENYIIPVICIKK